MVLDGQGQTSHGARGYCRTVELLTKLSIMIKWPTGCECEVKCTSTQPQRLAVRTQPMRDREVGLGVFTMCDVGHVHLWLKKRGQATRHAA